MAMTQDEFDDAAYDVFEERVEELRASLLEFEEGEILEALVLNTVVDPKTGKLTDYWMSLLNPELHKE